jgi:hypothetical protein
MTGLLKERLQSISEARKNVVGSAAATTDCIAGFETSDALGKFGLLEKESHIPMLHGFVLGVNASYRVEVQ